MKYFILVLLFFTYHLSISQADTTEKYNDILDQYEYYDSNRQLLGIKKYNEILKRYEFYDPNGQLVYYKEWNSVLSQYETTYINSNNSRKKKESNYIQPYDFEAINNALQSRQNSFDNNTSIIQREIDGVYKVYRNLKSDERYKSRWGNIDEIENELYTYVNRIGRLDFSSRSTTNSVLNDIGQYKSKFLRIKSAVIDVETKKETENEKLRTLYRSFSSYPIRIKDGWHNVQIINDSDFFKKKKVYVSNNQITKFVKNNSRLADIVYSTNIKNGYCRVKTTQFEEYYEVVFIDYIRDPHAITKAPTIFN